MTDFPVTRKLNQRTEDVGDFVVYNLCARPDSYGWHKPLVVGGHPSVSQAVYAAVGPQGWDLAPGTYRLAVVSSSAALKIVDVTIPEPTTPPPLKIDTVQAL